MKPKLYEIISRCVLDGIAGAKIGEKLFLRDHLTDKEIENIRLSVMSELTDYIDFGTNDK